MKNIAGNTLPITMVKPGVYTPGNKIKRRSIDTAGFSKRAVLINISHHSVPAPEQYSNDIVFWLSVGMADLPLYPDDIADLDNYLIWGADEKVEDLIAVTPSTSDEPRQYLFDLPGTGGRYVWARLRENRNFGFQSAYEIGMSATLLLSGGGAYPLDPAKYPDRVTP